MFSEELEKIDWEETTKTIYSKTESDVLRALGKEHCDVDDFMALISPAAAKYLEPMAQLSKKYTSAPLMRNTQQIYAGYTYGKNDLVETYQDFDTSRGFLV